MSKKIGSSFVVLFLVATLILTACTPQSQPETSPAPKQEFVIGLLLSDLSNPFFVSMQEGAEEAANRLGATLIVADAGNDMQVQAEQANKMLEDGVDALLINPVDSEAIGETIGTSNAKNVPVITLDRSATTGTVIAHIASDNIAGGEMAGNFLAELLSKKGNVVELQGLEGTSAAQDRGTGFNQAIANYPEITLLSQETADFNREKAREVFAKMLAEYPEINGVFAHNDDMILGAIQAAKEAGRTDIFFVGFDAVEDAVVAVENGELAATIAQQPGEIGRLGVETVINVLNGENVESYIPVELALIQQ